ncbi:flagellar biosynthetic protein FliO [Alicyclobacillus shizuokensis]|uniref:flagellar biosynthetic protein FliO n=1 Tax=Alicyclobacillus shizuokensis TaxID=392014 RepID=UPI00082B79BA|nr:flagellar biosynthetic protein FliO [Alicyclobacillus shizuokensis]MCL6625934.1 flagellar biosynthetic protein FliO [Alicyclobacillus shizuokensis]
MSWRQRLRNLFGAATLGWAAGGWLSVAWAKTSTVDSAVGNTWLMGLRLLLALGVILTLVLLTLRWLGHKGGVPARGAIEVLAARQIAPGRFVQVIQVENRRYLIGVGEQVSLLADVTEDYPVPEGTWERSDAAPTDSPAAVLAAAVQAVRDKRLLDIARTQVPTERPEANENSAPDRAIQEHGTNGHKDAAIHPSFSHILTKEWAQLGEEDFT